jgi:GTPase
MAQQTAVEWLFEKLWDEPKDKFTWYALREKAIKMEKEQLENARPQIISNCVIKEISDEEIRKQAIKYDNQAFSETPIAHFIEGAKWYREQLKKK